MQFSGALPPSLLEATEVLQEQEWHSDGQLHPLSREALLFSHAHVVLSPRGRGLGLTYSSSFHFPFAQRPPPTVLWFPSCLHNSCFSPLSCFRFPLGGKNATFLRIHEKKMRTRACWALTTHKHWSIPRKEKEAELPEASGKAQKGVWRTSPR